MKANSIIVLLAFILLTSCTITNRKYMPGYYVESTNSVVPKARQLTEKINIIHPLSISSVQRVSPLVEPKMEAALISNTPVIFTNRSNKIKRKLEIKDLVKPVHIVGDTTKHAIVEKRVDADAKVSFWAGMSLILLPVAMVPLGSDVFYPAGASDANLGYYIFFGFLFWFILAIIGLTSGISAMKYIKHHSDTTSGSDLASFGVVLSSIVLAISVVALLILISLIVAV